MRSAKLEARRRAFCLFTTALVTASTLNIAVAADRGGAPDKIDSGVSSVPNLSTEVALRAGFGRAVAVGEGEVFVGEPTSFKEPGMVRIFRRSADGKWNEVAILKAPDAEVGDGFGQVVATSGSILVVGHPSANQRTGALYSFARNAETGDWRFAGQVAATKDESGIGLGAAVAVSGDRVYAGAPGYNDGNGAIVVFQIQADGSLRREHTISAPVDMEGLRLGSSIAISDNTVVAGAPGYEAGNGAVLVFEKDANGVSWHQEALLTSPDDDGARLGLVVSTDGDQIAASMPGFDRANGAVAVFQRNGSSEWDTARIITPDSSGSRLMFGAAIQFVGDELWIGEPGADEMTGAVRIYRRVGTDWSRTSTLTDNTVDARDQLGGNIAARGSVVVVSAAGDAYGEGAALVFERSDGVWSASDFIFNDIAALDPILGNQVDCAEGAAAGYSCENVDLISFIPNEDIDLGRGVRLNDVWGWTDPDTGREYALIGTMEETVFLDLADPANPVFLGKLPKTEGSRGNTWRDIKTYANHAFIVADGAGQHGMQVFDLTQLRDVKNPPVVFKETALYDGIASSHNIIINEETGFAYTVGNSSGGETCGGALHMIDIKDPLNPTFAGCFNDPRTGGGSGATHDAQCVVYHGPDSEHRGKEICIGSNGTAISVADVTDKSNPSPISYRGYPTSAYVHQGWLTDDHRYFYQNDEGDELSGKVDRTRTLVWDLADLDDPILVTEFFGPTNSTDHNLYVDGDYMYETNNASGLRIIDISDRENPVEFGYFDTTPYGKDVAGFNGTWSSYPYFRSGMIVVTSRREGVFVVKKRERDL